ncbi:MAG: PilZ domain-containing protein [Desulfopila sp.]|jgi:hypothetical protein|nr:PilZ domain-containing protein [Desulfopila sp.]
MKPLLPKKIQQGKASLQVENGVICLSENISRSGMLCYSTRKIEELTLLEMKFQLPNDESSWIECLGVVVRCEKKVTGESMYSYDVEIFFDRISDKHRDLLAAFSGCNEVIEQKDCEQHQIAAEEYLK